MEHAHARRVDADDAARRPARRRPGAARAAGAASAQKVGQAVTRDASSSAQLEEERDPRGLSQSRCRFAARSSASTRSRRRCSASTRAASTAHEAAIAAALVRGPNANAGRRSRSAPAACCKLQRLDCAGVDGAAPRSALVRAGRHAARRAARAALRAPGASTRGEAGRARGPQRRSTPRCSASRSTRCAASSPSSRGRNVEDGAVVVLDNASGEVLAWVGSRGDLSRRGGGRRRARAPPAGLDAEAVRLRARVRAAAHHAGDAARRFAGAARAPPAACTCRRTTTAQFKGWVSARTALGASLNVPAVRVGAMLGADALFARLNALRPRAAGKRRLLRRVARARQRRRHAARR